MTIAVFANAPVPMSAPPTKIGTLEGDVIPQSMQGFNSSASSPNKWRRNLLGKLVYDGRRKAPFTVEAKRAIADVYTAVGKIGKTITGVVKTAGSWAAKLYPAFTDWVDSKLVLPAPIATPENYNLMSEAMRARHDAYVSRWVTAA